MSGSRATESQVTESQVIAQTRCWLQTMVLRHNFCPFAHKPFQQETIRYAVSQASEPEAVADDLRRELLQLRDCTSDSELNADSKAIDTTLLMTPHCFANFHDYNDFLDVADVLIQQLQLEGVIQVASFHPNYQFARLDIEDVRNYTCRSLYPMFHLILETSIDHARATHPDVHQIPQTNMTLLEKQGLVETLRQLDACRKVRR